LFRWGVCPEGQPDIRKRIVMITFCSESGKSSAPARPGGQQHLPDPDDGGRADDLAPGHQAQDLGRQHRDAAPATYNGWVTSRRAAAGYVGAHR
jgi:hypothetical protein